MERAPGNLQHNDSGNGTFEKVSLRCTSSASTPCHHSHLESLRPSDVRDRVRHLRKTDASSAPRGCLLVAGDETG